MARPKNKKQQALLWVISLILVASMVCSLTAVLRPGVLFGRQDPTPTPQPTLPWDAADTSVAPNDAAEHTQELRDSQPGLAMAWARSAVPTQMFGA